MTENAKHFAAQLAGALAPNDDKPPRFQLLLGVGGTTRGLLAVAVVADLDADLEVIGPLAETWASLAVANMQREDRIASCSGHEWEQEFNAAYLNGQPDAICRCGALRSEVGH